MNTLPAFTRMWNSANEGGPDGVQAVDMVAFKLLISAYNLWFSALGSSSKVKRED